MWTAGDMFKVPHSGRVSKSSRRTAGSVVGAQDTGNSMFGKQFLKPGNDSIGANSRCRKYPHKHHILEYISTTSRYVDQ